MFTKEFDELIAAWCVNGNDAPQRERRTKARAALEAAIKHELEWERAWVRADVEFARRAGLPQPFYTELFPPGVEPPRHGLYLTRYHQDSNCEVLCYWDGSDWFGANSPARDAYTVIGGVLGAGQRRWWRGLAFDPAERGLA